ncbi:MAG: TIGR01244 family phosphatase [Alphaproteobacteria bacterium]|nr:TIGR01244 family phosphatase [Alphaproteobacteria bacterium]
MPDFRQVTDTLWVSPQISLEDVAAAKALGVALIINNRPDGEELGQPAGAQIEAAARNAGLSYVAIPVAGRPQAAQVEAMQAALAPGARTLAYCRSGTRSIMTWALGRAATDDKDDLLRRGAAAGYDLSMVLGN